VGDTSYALITVTFAHDRCAPDCSASTAGLRLGNLAMVGRAFSKF